MKAEIGIILLCGFLLATHVLPAQSEDQDRSLKYFNKTEAGISFGIGNFKSDVYNGVQKKVRNDEIIATFQTVNGFKYNNKVSVGLSAGAELWQNGLFWPVCAYLSYDFKPANQNFFADIYIGYAFGDRNATSFYHGGKGALAFSLGIGYKMKVTKKLRFMYEIFYKYQAIESSYDNKVEYEQNDTIKTYINTVNYKQPLNFAGFKIGVCFP